MHHLRRRRIGIAALFFAVAAPAAGAEPGFSGLGFLPGGDSPSIAEGISADGSVVVGWARANGPLQAFRWTSSTGMTSLGALPGSDGTSEAFDVSADGSVAVGYSRSPSGEQAFRWTASGGMVGLGDLSGGSFSSRAQGVSSDGSVVVGGSVSGSGSEAFRWTASGGMAGLGDLPGGDFGSGAYAASADGSAVAGGSVTSSAPEAEAFLWTAAGGMTSIDASGGADTAYAQAVSADASVVVGYGTSASGWEAFRWTPGGGVVGLGDLPGGTSQSFAFDVSADGSVVVGQGVSDDSLEAFVWDPVHGMREVDALLESYEIDLGGWHLTSANAVSDDGSKIVGYGTNPNGRVEAWIANIAYVRDDLEIDLFARVDAPGQPEGIAVAPDGTVYVGTNRAISDSDPFPSVLFAYDSLGRLVDQWPIAGQNPTNSALLGLALDGDGAVYALDADPPRVLRIHPPTGVQTTYATFHDVLPCSLGGAPGNCSAGTLDQAPTPNYPVFAPDGTLYVTDSAQGLIWRIPPGGGPASVWFTDPALEGVFGPNGIQFRADGTTLLFALTGYQGPELGFGTGRLYELPVLPNGDPGALSLFWTSQPVDGPDGFSIAASGNVYVALAGTNQLAVIGPTGSEIARVPATPVENAMLEVPMDMPASTAFLGNQLLMTNQSLFIGNPDSWAVYDIAANEPGLPLFYPLPEPGAALPILTGALLVFALARRRRHI